MRRRVLLLAFGLLVANSAFAQVSASSIPLAEVFGGVSYFRAGVTQGSNLAGWQAALDYNLSKHAGVVLDFGGQYKSVDGTTLSLYQYMFGPRFKHRSGRVTVFAHGLVGGDAAHVPGSTQGAFAAALGGGLDVNVSALVAIRVFQVDWIHDHTRDVWTRNLRGTVGVVFRFPKR
jgi:hypothetical protein